MVEVVEVNMPQVHVCGIRKDGLER